VHAVRPIGFAEGALGDQEIDHRRHQLRLVTPDHPFGLAQQIVGDAVNTRCVRRSKARDMGKLRVWVEGGSARAG